MIKKFLASISAGALLLASTQVGASSTPGVSWGANQPGTTVYAASPTVVGINVRSYGAKGNGSTDDTAAIQAAINAASSLGQYKVVVPSGNYCIKTGPLTVTTNGITLSGVNRQTAPYLNTCGADKSIITMSGFHDVLENFSINGSNTPGTVNPAVTLTSDCVECELINNIIAGGNYTVKSLSGEAYLRWNKIYNSYGPALLYVAGGGYFFRNKVDQTAPYAFPTWGTLSALLPWQGSHTYSAGDIVSNTGYLMQATSGGTSGLSAPALKAYGTNITDGTVIWQLLAYNGQIGIQVDTGSSAVLFSMNDTTGPFDKAIAVTNTLAGTAPQGVSFHLGTQGQAFSANVSIDAGDGITVTSTQNNANCLFIGCAGIVVGTGAGTEINLTGNDIFAVANGINLQGGSHTTITSNTISGTNVAAIKVGAGVSHWAVVGNDLGTGLWGANPIGVLVNAGASDYYQIVGNTLHGATTRINDGGTGLHKTIMDGSGGVTTINDEIKFGGASPSLSSCGTSPAFVGTPSDRKGVFQIGTTTTSCTLNFSTTLAASPACVITPIGSVSTTLSLTARTLSLFTVAGQGGADLSGVQVSYFCIE